jgi:hypothetical protein
MACKQAMLQDTPVLYFPVPHVWASMILLDLSGLKHFPVEPNVHIVEFRTLHDMFCLTHMYPVTGHYP